MFLSSANFIKGRVDAVLPPPPTHTHMNTYKAVLGVSHNMWGKTVEEQRSALSEWFSSQLVVYDKLDLFFRNTIMKYEHANYLVPVFTLRWAVSVEEPSVDW